MTSRRDKLLRVVRLKLDESVMYSLAATATSSGRDAGLTFDKNDEYKFLYSLAAVWVWYRTACLDRKPEGDRDSLSQITECVTIVVGRTTCADRFILDLDDFVSKAVREIQDQSALNTSDQRAFFEIMATAKWILWNVTRTQPSRSSAECMQLIGASLFEFAYKRSSTTIS